MSNQQSQENVEPESFLGIFEDGAEGHSPEEDEMFREDNSAPDPGDAPIPDDGDADSDLPPDGEEGHDGTGGTDSNGDGRQQDAQEGKPPAEQSPAPEPKPDPAETARLEQEIAGLRKRLHDTQSAMHRATTERARLAKELEELKQKRENDDDWFSEDDKSRAEKLEQDLKSHDEEIARNQAEANAIQQRNAEIEWDRAAAPVIRQHPDFEEVVYGKLTPLIHPKTGNPQFIAAWNELADKSPASVYDFARNVLDILDFQHDPKGYKERLRKEFQSQGRSQSQSGRGSDGAAPTGKAGLDMLNGAPEPVRSEQDAPQSFVSALFGGGDDE